MSLPKSEISEILHIMGNIITHLIDHIDNDIKFKPYERRTLMNTLYQKMCGVQMDKILSHATTNYKLQLKRGNTSANNAYVGLSGEITMDTDANTLRVHDGETAGGIALANIADIAGDWVVESQLPTAENNYTWYRKYKSGWVEMGGVSTNDKLAVVTLPVSLQDTNYTISFATTGFGSTNYDPCIANIRTGTITTMGFTIQHKNHSGQSYAMQTRWRVSGFTAQ